MKSNIINRCKLALLIAFAASCAHQQDGVKFKNEHTEKYGTIVQIERMSSHGLNIPGELGGVASLVYYGGQAIVTRDSLKISLRMDDGTSLIVAQKVKTFEHFGVGDRVKVLNRCNVTH